MSRLSNLNTAATAQSQFERLNRKVPAPVLPHRSIWEDIAANDRKAREAAKRKARLTATAGGHPSKFGRVDQPHLQGRNDNLHPSDQSHYHNITAI